MADDEAAIREMQLQRRTLDTQRDASESDKGQLKVGGAAQFDSDIYGTGKSRFAGYDTSIDAGGDVDMADGEDAEPRQLDSCACQGRRERTLTWTDTAPKHLLHEFADPDAEDPFHATTQAKQIAERESEYQKRRFNRGVDDPNQLDPFKQGQDGQATSSYGDAMRLANLEREEQRVAEAIATKEREAREEALVRGEEVPPVGGDQEGDATPKKRRWDAAAMGGSPVAEALGDATNKAAGVGWDPDAPSVPKAPAVGDGAAPKKRRSRWDQTTEVGAPSSGVAVETKPAATPRRSRWDQTPVNAPAPVAPQPMPVMLPPGPQFAIAALDPRNMFLSDSDLDRLLPTDGYEIIAPPAGYAPIRRPGMAMAEQQTGFIMQDPESAAGLAGMAVPDLSTEIEGVGQLAFFKHEDALYFQKVLEGEGGDSLLSTADLTERKILRLLLKIKNGCVWRRRVIRLIVTAHPRCASRRCGRSRTTRDTLAPRPCSTRSCRC